MPQGGGSHFCVILFLKNLLQIMQTCEILLVMDYKSKIKDYKTYRREYEKRCVTMLKAFGDIDPPTEEQWQALARVATDTHKLHSIELDMEVTLLHAMNNAYGDKNTFA